MAKTTRQICDCPGCTVPVPRGKLMCRAHWFATPRHLREAISAAWKERRMQDWSANCLSARGYHAGIAARSAEIAARRVTPEQSFALQQRMLGER